MGNSSKFYTHGNPAILSNLRNGLGIVGSRNILNYTKNVLDDLFLDLVGLDITIISGGMYGVDIYAHNLALKNGLKTIVVLPCGISTYFKSSLYSQLKISKNSEITFISKYEDSQNSRKYTFLERNKEIVNLSECILIAQASEKSGTIYTANYSLSQKKQVFSIPINLDTKQFQGTNLLISKGSGIYLKPDSVLNALKINKTSDFNGKFDFSCINGNTIEEIKKISGTDEGLIQKTLLKLILEGRVFQSEGRYYKC